MSLYQHPELYHAEYEAADLQDVEFWRYFSSKGRLLECGSGTGRLFPLWQECGADYVGLESVKTMSQYCKKLHPEATLIESDMRCFDTDNPFDRIALPLNLFNHLTDRESQMNCLRSCHKVLKQDGLIAIDIFNAQAWIPYGDFKRVRSFTHDTHEWSRYEKHQLHMGPSPLFDLELEYRRHDSQVIVSSRTTLRIVGRYEIQWLLENTGYKVRASFGDHHRGRYHSFSPHILMIAQKN